MVIIEGVYVDTGYVAYAFSAWVPGSVAKVLWVLYTEGVYG